MKLSEKIVFLRKRKGMSQEALANELDVSRQAVYKWETGITTPEIEKLKKISEIFEVSFDDLLNDKIDISNPPVVSTNTEEVVPPPLPPSPPKKRFLPFIIAGAAAALIITTIIVVAIILGNMDKHTHAWGKYNVDVAPSCTVAGVERRICKDCGEEETRSIPTVAHSEIIIEGRASTCTTKGLSNGKKCSVCQVTLSPQKTLPLAEDNHKAIKTTGYSATCISSGLSNGKKCEDCGKILEKQVTIAPLGHEIVDHEAKAPTCNEPGFNAYETCNVCSYTTYKEIPATGHTLISHEAKAPTCIEIGWESYQSCKVCSYSTYKELPAKGHTEAAISGTPATCKSTGLTDGIKCTACNEIIKAQEIIPMTNHTESILKEVKPTCTKTGLTEGLKCSACGEILIKQEIIPVSSENHTQVTIVGVPATCLETGLTDGIKCSECNNTLQEQAVIPVLAHTEKVVLGYASTCTKKGLTNGKVCNVCSTILEAQIETPINEENHSPVTISGYAATCIATGLTDGSKCNECGNTLLEQTEIPITDHIEAVIKGYPATCLTDGLTDGKECSYCHKVLLAQETIVSAGQHVEETVLGYAPTCTSTGRTDGKRCTICGETTLAQTVISSTGHTKVTTEGTPSTCTENGVKSKTVCSVCNAVLSSGDPLPLANHTVENDKCTVCGLEANTNLTFTLNEDGESYSAAINEAVQAEDSIIIPSSYNGKPVTKTSAHTIPYGYVYSDSTIKSIYLPSTITHIGENSFNSFTKLEVINIPVGTTFIGADAIAWCKSLTELYIPNTVKTMVLSPFDEGNPDMILYCQNGASTNKWDSFWCHYTEIYHSNHTESIDYTVVWFDYVDGEIVECADFRYSLNEGDTSYTVYGINSDSTSSHLEIPSEYNGLPVTAIGESAFEGNENITSVYIPSSIKTIGGSAFYTCSSLHSVTMESGIEEIYPMAFAETAITWIFIPDTVTLVGPAIFDGCSSDLKIKCEVTAQPADWSPIWNLNGSDYHLNVTWGYSLDGIFVYSLNEDGESYSVKAGDTGITELVIPSAYKGLPVTKIDDYGFQKLKNIFSVTIPGSIKTIGQCAFYQCTNITNIVIENGVEKIGNNAFQETSITKIALPSSVTTLGGGVFFDCPLDYIYVPNTVTMVEGPLWDDGIDQPIYCQNGTDTTNFQENWCCYANESAMTLEELWVDRPIVWVDSENDIP
ncbi:MAG: leucine-rich repeat protein [Clostridia bacterium]|nr:leucine-rich repeat protein [Clostridia bacterium]